jgi:K(+)-stimulated pyrophosphate-energized sodium pump
MNYYYVTAPVLGITALLFAYFISITINKLDIGTERMKEISAYIEQGAMAFLSRQYKALVIFTGILYVILGLGIGWITAHCFLLGAFFSALAGFFGMKVATKANVRTANAARQGGMNELNPLAV